MSEKLSWQKEHTAEVAKLRADLKAAREVLRDNEWCCELSVCPECYSLEKDGHDECKWEEAMGGK